MSDASRVLFRSSRVPGGRTGTGVEVSRRRAGWRLASDAARRVGRGSPWKDATRGDECRLVRPAGTCRGEVDGSAAALGPRRDVADRFADPNAYGFQRLYDDQRDRTPFARHREAVRTRRGHHPFVTAYGYNAYYLSAWLEPGVRLPLVPRPAAGRFEKVESR